MPVYRYKLSDPTLARLSSEVPGSPTAGDLAPAVFVDVALSNPSYKADLDDAMLAKGYSYLSTDPTTTPAQQANSEPGIAGPYTGVSREVRVASTVDVPTISGLLTIDTITVSAGDRVLLKNQNTGSQNGIYIADSGAWSYATDWATGAIVPEMVVYVSEGSANQHTKWRVTNQGTITVGSTAVMFANDTGGTDADAIHKSVSGDIASLTEKVPPVSGDWLLIEDSAASNAKKKVQVGNMQYQPRNRTKIRSVGATSEYTTIGAALTAASDGDTILVEPGEYPEKLTITKRVSIVGLSSPMTAYASGPMFPVINPTLTASSEKAVTGDTGSTRVLLANLMVAPKHQATATDSTYGLYWLSTAGELLMDNVTVAPEVITGAGAGTFCNGMFVSTGRTVEAHDCTFSVEDPLNIITTGDGYPLTAYGTGTKVTLVTSRIRAGQNMPGDVGLQNSATLNLQAAVIEGQIKEGGTGGTTVNVDAASRIASVDSNYPDNDTQTKLNQRSYGLVDTGGQKEQYKVNLVNIAGDVGSAGNGDIWYSTVRNRFRIRQLGASYDLRSLWDCTKIRTVSADGSADYTTIQAAIDAASSGDTVVIAPGTYTEQLTLKNGVNLYAIDKVRVYYNLTSADGCVVSVPSGSTVICWGITFESTYDANRNTSVLLLPSGSSFNLTFNQCSFLAISQAINSGTGINNCIRTGTGVNGTINLNDCSVLLTDSLVVSSGTPNVVKFDGGAGSALTLVARDTLFRLSLAFSSKVKLDIADGVASLYNCAISGTGQPFARTTGTVEIYGSLASGVAPSLSFDADDDSSTVVSKTLTYVVLTNGKNRAYKLPLRAITSDPTSPADGDIWYNSSTGKLRARVSSTTINIRTPTTRFEQGVHSTTVITTGAKGRKTFSYTGTIIGWRLVSDQNTNATIDLWKANGSIPTNANSITGTGKPSLTGAQLNSGDVSLWTTTTVAAGDVIILEVEANSAATYLALELEILLDG